MMQAPSLLGLAALLLVACTGHPADTEHSADVVAPAPPDRPSPPPLAGALSVRFSPEGATAPEQVDEVVAEATVSGGDGRLRLWVDFVEPGGTTYQRAGAEVDAPSAGGQRLVALSVPVSGTDAVRYPGTWTAVLGGPQGPLASASFALREVAP